jgi:hypothetical protein
MKTTLYFILSLLISAGCLLSAVNTRDPFPLFGVAFGIWPLFFWAWKRRLKKVARRREMERQFSEFMRDKHHRF